VSYAFAFIQAPADELPADRVDEQRAMRLRRRICSSAPGSTSSGGWRQGGPAFAPPSTLEGRRPRCASCVGKTRITCTGGRGVDGAFSADPFDFTLI